MSDTSKKTSYTTLKDSQFGRFHMFCQWLSIKLTGFYLKACFDFKIKGKENQPKGFQSYVAVCNHTSNLDPPMMSNILDFQPIAYMSKQELFDPPLLRLYMQSVSAFAVNRDKLEVSTVKTAIKVLKHGKWALGIFPEGSRQKDGSLGEAKRGAAYFAKAGNAPVLPIGVYKQDKKIRVRIGPLIPPSDDLDALTLTIQQRMADLIEQAEQDP